MLTTFNTYYSICYKLICMDVWAYIHTYKYMLQCCMEIQLQLRKYSCNFSGCLCLSDTHSHFIICIVHLKPYTVSCLEHVLKRNVG